MSDLQITETVGHPAAPEHAEPSFLGLDPGGWVALAMLAVFAVTHGMAWGLRGPMMQAIRADYFGLRAIGMVLGMSALLIAFGQISGPIVAGAGGDGSRPTIALCDGRCRRARRTCDTWS
jgi:MFS family permease